MTRTRLLALALLCGALLSLRFGALSLFVAFGCFLFWVTLPTPKGRERRALTLLTGLCLAVSCAGLARFVATQAFVGMAEAARSGTSKSVVSRLREIQFSESRAQQLGLLDPDGNQRGAALFLEELSGSRPLRGTGSPTAPLLDAKYQRRVSTPAGPATQLNGYLFFVCLPGANGTSTADPTEPVDERASEARFVAYAWPQDEHRGHGQLFSIDAGGQVLVYDNRGTGEEPSFVGPQKAPPCRLLETEARRFSPWRGKDSPPR
jgi:hypothetical protein